MSLLQPDRTKRGLERLSRPNVATEPPEISIAFCSWLVELLTKSIPKYFGSQGGVIIIATGAWLKSNITATTIRDWVSLLVGTPSSQMPRVLFIASRTAISPSEHSWLKLRQSCDSNRATSVYLRANCETDCCLVSARSTRL